MNTDIEILEKLNTDYFWREQFQAIAIVLHHCTIGLQSFVG